VKRSLSFVAAFFLASLVFADSELETDLRLEITNLRVTDMPFSIRDIPPHHDDAGFSHPGPIMKISYPAYFILSLGYPVAKTKIDDSSSIEIVGRLMFYPTVSMARIAERNYTNNPGSSQRGYGAALTFVGLETWGIIPAFDGGGLETFLNLTPEVLYKRRINDQSSINFSLSYLSLQAVTGWDRYDSRDVKDRYTLAYCFPLGVTYQTEHFCAGVKYYLMSLTNIGEEAKVKGNFGLSLAYKY